MYTVYIIKESNINKLKNKISKEKKEDIYDFFEAKQRSIS